MYKNKKIVAIIPARGGSKGIPHKNIVKLVCRPLIVWTIEHAKNSKLIDKVCVSTDDKKIAKVCHKYGAEIIERPIELATDTSSSESALLHAIDFIEYNKKFNIDIVVFLQCTSPLRERDDIDNAIRKFFLEGADSLFSCTKLEDHFIWERRKDNFVGVNHDYRNRKRRQNIKPQYLENGSIYIFKPELIRREHNRLGGKIAIYEMDQWKSYQVDRPDDLDICEYYIRKKILKHGNNDGG